MSPQAYIAMWNEQTPEEKGVLVKKLEQYLNY